MEDDKVFLASLNKISTITTYYSCLAMVSIGLTTNILNLLLSIRPKIRKIPMGFYNIFISVFNMICLAYGLLIYFPVTIGQPDLTTVSNNNCILINLIGRISIHMSSWINVMISLDRMLCITYRNKFLYLKGKRNICLIIFAMLLVIVILNSPNLFLRVVTRTDNSTWNQTGVSISSICSSDDGIILIRDILGQLVRTVIPVILEFVLNGVLIFKLIKYRRNISVPRSLNRDYKFAFIIVILNLTFFITQFPLIVCVAYASFLNFVNVSAKHLMIVVFVKKVTVLFAAFMFYSIFFVNIIFNKIYKIELFNAIHETIALTIKSMVWVMCLFEKLVSISKNVNTRIFTSTNISTPVLISYKITLHDRSNCAIEFTDL